MTTSTSTFLSSLPLNEKRALLRFKAFHDELITVHMQDLTGSAVLPEEATLEVLINLKSFIDCCRIQEAYSVLPRIFDIWFHSDPSKRILHSQFNQFGKRVSDECRGKGLEMIDSAYPSAFLLGNSYWRKVILRETQKFTKKLTSENKVLIKSLIEVAVNCTCYEDSLLIYKNKIAMKFNISQPHAHAIYISPHIDIDLKITKNELDLILATTSLTEF